MRGPPVNAEWQITLVWTTCMHRNWWKIGHEGNFSGYVVYHLVDRGKEICLHGQGQICEELLCVNACIPGPYILGIGQNTVGDAVIDVVHLVM